MQLFQCMWLQNKCNVFWGPRPTLETQIPFKKRLLNWSLKLHCTLLIVTLLTLSSLWRITEVALSSCRSIRHEKTRRLLIRGFSQIYSEWKLVVSTRKCHSEPQTASDSFWLSRARILCTCLKTSAGNRHQTLRSSELGDNICLPETKHIWLTWLCLDL